MQPGALAAIRRGQAGVHVLYRAAVYEALAVDGPSPWGAGVWIITRHLNGEPGPDLPADETRALERTYEAADSTAS